MTTADGIRGLFPPYQGCRAGLESAPTSLAMCGLTHLGCSCYGFQGHKNQMLGWRCGSIPVSFWSRLGVIKAAHQINAAPSYGLTARVSQLQAHSYGLPATGSQLLASSYRLTTTGSQLQARSYGLPGTGWQLQAYNYKLTAKGSQLQAHNYRLTATGSQPQAYSYGQTAKGSL